MSDQDRIAALEATVDGAHPPHPGAGGRAGGPQAPVPLRLSDRQMPLRRDRRPVHRGFRGPFLRRLWKGKEGARRLYVDRFQANFTHDNNGPIDGFLLDHPQHQDIIDIEPDGKTALAAPAARCRPGGTRIIGERRGQWWEGGIYENTYKKVDGVWRIHILNYCPQWHADFENGWANTKPELRPLPRRHLPRRPDRPRRADRPTTGCGRPTRWCRSTMKHPVTGEEIVPSAGRATSSARTRPPPGRAQRPTHDLPRTLHDHRRREGLRRRAAHVRRGQSGDRRGDRRRCRWPRRPTSTARSKSPRAASRSGASRPRRSAPRCCRAPRG